MNAKRKSNREGKPKPGKQNGPPLRKGDVHAVSILAAAEQLGCSFGHLRKVLTGERVSPTLLAKYKALVANAA